MILVLGSSGFLGAATANKLAEEEEVVAVMRPTSSDAGILPNKNISILRVEERDWKSLVLNKKPRVVVCSHWQGVQKDLRNNNEVQFQNVQNIIEIARAAREVKSQKFLAYGSQAESLESSNPIEESILDTGVSEYGRAKSLLSKELFSIFKNSETQLTWVRIFTVYGPNDKRASVIRQMIEALKTGHTFQIDQPEQRVSFLYIEDFAEGIKYIIGRIGESDVINLANPDLLEIRKLPHLIGSKKFIMADSSKDPKIGYFPIVDKLEQLGWKSRTSIEAGCKLTMESLFQE